MAQRHMDRLSAIDASFLLHESPATHMHVGGVAVFEGPPPALGELLDTLLMRLHLVPRYRQKLVDPPARAGRPLWVDDRAFDLANHVRAHTLAPPGSGAELERLTALIFSRPLDRSLPLWELWLVDGLDDGRFAIVNKTHHAMIDGVAGVDLAQLIFDLAPEPREVDHVEEPWHPAPEPSPSAVLAHGVRGLVRSGARALTATAAALSRPEDTLRSARVVAGGLGQVARAALQPAPPTPLNREIGPHRRYTVVRSSLADVKAVKDAFGGTVNDVVLSVVAGGLRSWLQSRGVPVQALELQALVPVSIRTDDERGAMGNRLAAMRGPLPVSIEDPVARLRVVREAMDGLKDSRQALGAEILASVQGLAPAALLGHATRLNLSTRFFNLIVTNVPGPQVPLYVRGRELLDVSPVALLPRGHALAVAIMSYNGRLNFGLLGDHDALEDIDTVAEGIDSSLASLVSSARRRAEGGTAGDSRSGGSGATATAAGRRAGRARSGRTRAATPEAP